MVIKLIMLLNSDPRRSLLGIHSQIICQLSPTATSMDPNPMAAADEKALLKHPFIHPFIHSPIDHLPNLFSSLLFSFLSQTELGFGFPSFTLASTWPSFVLILHTLFDSLKNILPAPQSFNFSQSPFLGLLFWKP